MVNKIEILKEAFEIVAGDANFQINYLKKIGIFNEDSPEWKSIGVDEIALQLIDDADYIITHLKNKKLASNEFLEMYFKLKNLIIRKNGEYFRDFWIVDALFNDSRWEEIRAAAKLCIEFMPKSIPEDVSPLVR